MDTTTPFITFQETGDSPVHRILGGAVAIRLDGEATGGALAMLEMHVPAGYPGPPLHRHPHFDETFYILDGTLAVRFGDSAADAGPGSVLHVPRGQAHTFANRSAGPVHMLVLAAPAGHERFFEALAELLEGHEGPPPLDAIIELNERYGTEMVEPAGG